MAGKKSTAIPGFTQANDQIYIREPPTAAPNSPNDPDMVLIFSWGDGLPKHVAKYAEGFNKVFPAARQILVLGPISKTFFASLATRVADMDHVLEALKGYIEPDAAKRSKILVHAMSNTGASNYASMLKGYVDKYNQPFPHDLVILDSTPGSPFFSFARLAQWSRAMSMGIAHFFPWPEIVTRFMMAVATIGIYIACFIRGEEPAGVFAVRVIDDKNYEQLDAKRMYLYSKEDQIISWTDIEMFQAESRSKGWETRSQMFEGSPHVGHMRQHPAQYWAAVRDAWYWAVGK